MSIFQRKEEPFAATGTTSPIYLPREGQSQAVEPGAGYFYVKIAGAQAAFTGRFWEQVRQLIVTSQVALNHAQLGPEPFNAIQRYRPVKPRQAEQLGLSPNLISVVPATMSHISLSVGFLLDKRNRLVDLGNLINDDTFIAAVSLAPGAAMVARTIGTLSQKLIQTFLDAEEREPILQFSGDFNLAGNDLRDGYYVVLGTRDAENPLPSSTPSLTVQDGTLFMDGRVVTQLSYVIFDVRTLPVRTRALNDGAAWAEKLRRAEEVAQRVALDFTADQADRERAWQECKILLKEAQLLLLLDPNYLPGEAQDIVKQVYQKTTQHIFGPEGLSPRKGFMPEETAAERAFFDIAPEENLETAVASYEEQVAAAQQVLRADA